MSSRKINTWSKAEAKAAKKFDVDRDYVFLSKTGSAVTVFNRPEAKHKSLGFNSPALSRPMINKWGSYFVTNQVLVRNLFIAMNVASLFIFSDLLNIQLTRHKEQRIDLLNGPIFAFGLMLKYVAQLLLSQYAGPKAFDRVFKTIERVASYCCYAAEFASATFLLDESHRSGKAIFKNISYTVYAVSLLCAAAVAVLPNIPFWFTGCIYLCYLICGIIFVFLVKDAVQAALVIVVIVTQFVGGLFSMCVGTKDGANFKAFAHNQKHSALQQTVDQVAAVQESDNVNVDSSASSEQQAAQNNTAQASGKKPGLASAFEIAWLNWRYKDYFGPGELGLILIGISDLLMYALLRVGAVRQATAQRLVLDFK